VVSCQKHHYGDTGGAVTPRPFLGRVDSMGVNEFRKLGGVKALQVRVLSLPPFYVGLEHLSTITLRL